ncbi:hypothetical protein B0T10DRAFT_466691 [Thelonectria olida]|uniref:Uncharacterized protein n=1 Tax=Thelonectria olida TaxID=1576542 RepID=A0A9P9AEW5_9HYPO|nr:hypothetical protein B0T10DRAFT_466691 [Thelonectria olida]
MRLFWEWQILILLLERAPDLAERNNAADGDKVTCSSSFEDGNIGSDERINHVDETEVECEVATRDMALDDPKRRAMDRLAEVFARFKTASDMGKRENRNSIAKHVSSVAMIEESDSGRGSICSKCGGLNEVDEKSLKSLRQLLESVAGNGP